MNIPNCFYRVSVKALILNESKDKFLIAKEDTGLWEIPGGGLEWGKDPHEELSREIQEEMGLKTTWIADNPSYFLTTPSIFNKGTWIVNILYETKLEHLDFTPSNECREIAFVDVEDIKNMQICPQINDLAKKVSEGELTKY